MTNERAWLVSCVVFLFAALVCVSSVLSGVVEGSEMNFRVNDTSTYELIEPAISLYGLKLRAESWKRYPDYTIGLFTAAGISFAGAVWCAYQMERGKCES